MIDRSKVSGRTMSGNILSFIENSNVQIDPSRSLNIIEGSIPDTGNLRT